MTRSYELDLFVIGGGSAGVRLARTAGSLGARVALAEAARLGGTCVNLGCIPKKLLMYGAHVAHEIADAAGYGWSIPEARPDWSALRAGEEREVARLNGVYRNLLDRSGVTILEGRASLETPHSVRVGNAVLTAEHIVIATGAKPRTPDVPGAELGLVSDDCFSLPRLPRSIAIVGGGYIALEFAGIFSALGVETTLLVRSERVLPHFDRDVALFVQKEVEKKHVAVRTGARLSALERRGDRIAAVLGDQELLAVMVLFATGRTANLEGLGIDRLGIRTKPDGAIAFDSEYRTSVPSVRAIGDVIGHIQLTPVALAEGTALARSLFGGGGPITVSYEDIPTAVFTMPELAVVGLTEPQARTKYGEIAVFETEFRPLKHTVSGSTERTYAKLIVDRASDRVVGVHMVGTGAAEIMQGVAIAMRAGATKAHFDATIGIHPTSAEELVTMRTARAS